MAELLVTLACPSECGGPAARGPGVASKPTQGRNKVIAPKISQLMDWTKKNRVIRMRDSKFYRFILDPPRNYSVIVMFTTLQEVRLCGNCKFAAGEFQILANSWPHSRAFNKIFFAMVDYDECSEVFEKLQMKSVPTFLHFPTKKEFTLGNVYHLQERGIGAEQIAEWVVERTNINIRIRRPTSYHDRFMLEILLALISGLGYLLKWNKIYFSKMFWAIFALSFVTVMTAGQMWTHIQEAHSQRNPHTGRTPYIHKMSYSQLAAETYIISLFNMCITLGMVILGKAATSHMNLLKRKLRCMMGLCLVVIFFSWLLSLFRFKNLVIPTAF